MWDLVGNPKDWFSHNEAHDMSVMTESLTLVLVSFALFKFCSPVNKVMHS